jgi:DNA-binding transcriptional LysR family regulator
VNFDYLAAMRAFVRAAELGSFTKAADETGAKVSTVSRQVAALEADLGAALFNRSTRRLHLTEVGAAFLARASRILADVGDAREAASAINATPQGLLRINLPRAFGRRHVAPHLPDFLALYPDIRIDATLTDATVDLIETGTDVAVRIGALADSSLIAKRLAPHRRALVASPKYLQGRAPVLAPRDLERMDCLAFTRQPGRSWHLHALGTPEAEPVEIPVQGRLGCNDSEALLEIVLAGGGVALLPTWLAGADLALGRLVRLLPDHDARARAGHDPAIWGVYAPKTIVSPKVRVFLDFIGGRFGHPPIWDRE